MNGDGRTDSADSGIVLLAWGKAIGDAEYRPEADFNRDGVIDGVDFGIVMLATNEVEPGLISDAAPGAPDNTIGWDGYVFDAATPGYTVRNRTYLPELGPWVQRDPVGYVDGGNLHQYGASHSLGRLDAFGLQARFVPNLEVDPVPCQQVCSAAYHPGVDPTGFVRCMAGCMNGLRGADCKAYCGRWTDPVEVAACESGCDSSKRRVGGNCVVACPVEGGPPVVLAGLCFVAVAAPEPLVTKGTAVVLGAITCGCGDFSGLELGYAPYEKDDAE